MADYKRMVSYMYQYENGVKRKNVGYARVEAKNGQCRVTLHMQLLGQLDSIFPTYLIQRNESGIDLIYLGDSVLKAQVMDSKLSADEANIMNTGYGLSDMSGLLLFLNDSIFFATEWDDKPIIAKEVWDALKPKKIDINSEEKRQTNRRREQSLRPTRTVASSLLGTEIKKQQIDPKNDTSVHYKEEEPLSFNEDLQTSKYKLLKWLKTTESFLQSQVSEQQGEGAFVAEAVDQRNQMQSEAYVMTEEAEEVIPVKAFEGKKEHLQELQYLQQKLMELQLQLMKEDLMQEEDSREQQQEEFIQEYSDSEEPKEVEEASTEQLEQVPESELEAAEMMVKDHLLEETQANELQEEEAVEEDTEDGLSNIQLSEQMVGEMEEAKEQEEHPTAKHFFDHYPRIYPFEDNEIMLCVKIEPKDIGMLPKEVWALSNNSFLMHGFYCYHHLIFAKIRDHYGSRYILGIPGIYHNRERFMARMFGFEAFKSIRKRELKQGDFGYWYVTISF